MALKFKIFIIFFLLKSFQVFPQDTQEFISAINLKPLQASKDTGETPQSKTWYYGCKQWTVLPDSEGTHLWRLDEDKWTKILTLSKIFYKADCKVVDNVVHILLFRGRDKINLVSLEHVPSNNRYRPWTQRPTPSIISLDEGAYTASIDIDSKGRMWLASDASNSINVRWSDLPYSNWSEPITLATGVSNEDICAVVAMPGKIGVLWSNLNKQRFGFKTHLDGLDPKSWTSDEVPASQSALDIKLGMAHPSINIAIAKDGTLYCAVRTEYNSKGFTRIALLVRKPSGNWDNLYEVSQTGARPLVILNENKNILKVVYNTSLIEGNDIVYKESSTSKIVFGPQKTLIKGPYTDVTSSKDNYSSEVVILASNGKQTVGVLASDGINTVECPVYIGWFAYPNPFNDLTNIAFTLSEDDDYILNLYDSRGAKIAEINRGKAIADKANIVELSGLGLARGLYLIRLETSQEIRTLKLILEK